MNIPEYTFLITGGAGFIGSNIVEFLMEANAKKVRVLDDLSNGFYQNISKYERSLNFEFIEGDIRDQDICNKVMEGIDFVSHQAALGSVPRSIKDPSLTHSVNVNGFLNVITAAKNAGVRGFVYASSSSVYGDSKVMPKREDLIGKPLSPYAVSKLSNELYAQAFAEVYKFQSVGLRYFNIFGPRQDPDSQYSAVIPLFMKASLDKKAPVIFGDGLQSRDFTFVKNAVQANLKALFYKDDLKEARVYNIAVGQNISLLSLWDKISGFSQLSLDPIFKAARTGDVKDSLADISLSIDEIGYSPNSNFLESLEETFNWYKLNYKK